MEDLGNQQSVQEITEILFQTFGQTFSKEIIAAIVENCAGDANISANAIVNMIDDMNKEDDKKKQELPHNLDKNNIDQEPACNNDNLAQTSKDNRSKSYAGSLAQTVKKYPSTGTRPKNSNYNDFRFTQKKSFTKKEDQCITPQIKNIILQHSQGSRILIMMRGLPGSGKSYLAKKIVAKTIGRDFEKHILSTDDYFFRNGSYHFDKYSLQNAHTWNQNRAQKYMASGQSLIIIDNTNISAWELEPYVRNGVRYGYLIEVVEPNTAWAWKPQHLVKRNIHDVPLQSIENMLTRYDTKINSNNIMKLFNLSYPHKVLPHRNVQSVSGQLKKMYVSEVGKEIHSHSDNTIPSTSKKEINNEDLTSDNVIVQSRDIASKEPLVTESIDTNSDLVFEKCSDKERQIQDSTKVEQDWEAGESWNDDCETTVKSSTVKSAEHDGETQTAKPQRKCKKRQVKSHFSSLRSEHETEKMKTTDLISDNSFLGNSKSEIETEGLIPNTENFLKECQDWTKISLFMPPWEDTSKSDDSKPTIIVEKVDSSTCVESHDTIDITKTNKPYKILKTIPRDINFLYVPADKEKIPEKRMLDKSSMTNEETLTKTFRCQYENSHFKQLAKMYPFIEKSVLRDIFDRCHGDVNWTHAILAEELRNKQIPFKTNTDDLSLTDDDDEIPEGECSCLAAYGVSPNISPVHSVSTNSDSAKEIASERTPLKQRKTKKHVNISETSVKLKRELEKNVVISESHYSENFLKLRRLRRGELKRAKIESDNTKTTVDNEIPSTLKVDIEASSSCSETKGNAESQVDDKRDDDNEEKFVEICLGKEFVVRVDKLCGRQGSEYPSDIEPTITVPVSNLSDSNVMWVEFICDQLDQTPKQTDLMIKQDEEFARQLAEKEAEMAQAGMEPEVPDLKEIMDMELALSLYHKDVQAEWRSKEPSDLAAKLSRQKLFNLFPQISPDVLSELLMALDNNFNATLESLLLSTGLGDVLQTKNGIHKFVMEKELERQKQIIQEQKRALSEFEWPLLPKAGKVERSTVDDCRRDADMQLKRRNMIYERAREYFSRGMTQVASYYAQLAEMHTRKYEYLNCLAATYLIQVHAASNDTSIDLHFLRVPEAIEGLDLFLDSHIMKLRETPGPPHQMYRTLSFVTGRGIHSANGQPRIKPAAKRRLQERGIDFIENNPGLLTARVFAGHPLSSQVS